MTMDTQKRTMSKDRLPLIVTLFLAVLVIPVIFNIGTLVFSPSRVVLTIAIIPLLFAWMVGKSGPKHTADILVLLICVFATLSFIVNHGLEAAIEPMGILFIQTVAPYFLGRVFIRGPVAFHGMSRSLFFVVVALLPFTVWEALSGQNLILKLSQSIAESHMQIVGEPRWGLSRAQGPFAHPILYGVFCVSIFGLTYYVVGFGRSIFLKIVQSCLVLFSVVLSLSSGPMIACMAQGFIIGWDHAFRRFASRWKMLVVLSFAGYICVDIISDRTPLKVFISHFSFSPRTAYARLLIFDWGLENILANPLFGIGLNDWVRAPWMTSSVDMFWLQRAMLYGIPVGVLYLLTLFWIVVSVARVKLRNRTVVEYRKGYLVSLLGLFLVGWAVHLWFETYTLLMFVLGSGIWFVGGAGRWDEEGKLDIGGEGRDTKKIGHRA